MMIFFFFKQKTAYEMRISDWSSDVCSSDLPVCSAADRLAKGDSAAVAAHRSQAHQRSVILGEEGAVAPQHLEIVGKTTGRKNDAVASPNSSRLRHCGRSEEHTSELHH